MRKTATYWPFPSEHSVLFFCPEAHAGLSRRCRRATEGRNIFVEVEGQRFELSPMQANLIARAWLDVVGGAFVASENSRHSQNSSGDKLDNTYHVNNR